MWRIPIAIGRQSKLENKPDVAKLADALDLGSSEAIHVGSTPIIRTKKHQDLSF
jgi:hypothetical protein